MKSFPQEGKMLSFKKFIMSLESENDVKEEVKTLQNGIEERIKSIKKELQSSNPSRTRINAYWNSILNKVGKIESLTGKWYGGSVRIGELQNKLLLYFRSHGWDTSKIEESLADRRASDSQRLNNSLKESNTHLENEKRAHEATKKDYETQLQTLKDKSYWDRERDKRKIEDLEQSLLNEKEYHRRTADGYRSKMYDYEDQIADLKIKGKRDSRKAHLIGFGSGLLASGIGERIYSHYKNKLFGSNEMLSFEEFIIACENSDPKYDEERHDKIAELKDKYQEMKEKSANLTKESLHITRNGIYNLPPEDSSRMENITAEQKRLKQEMDKTHQEIERLSQLKLDKMPDELYHDPETHEGINDRLKQIDTELSSLNSVKSSELTSTQIRQKERLHAERLRLFNKKVQSPPQQKEAKVGKKASLLKKTGKYGLGVAAVGGLAYGGYKLLHRKEASNEGMLSFENFLYEIERN